MSDEWPRMLYRKGGEEDVFGLKCETTIVESEDEEQAAEGWFRTPFEAHGVEPPKADPVEDQPPLDDEKLGLLDEIEELQRHVTELREQLTAAETQRTSAEAELKETKELLSEATKPAEKPKETLGIKAGK